jgi:hypothetical protein
MRQGIHSLDVEHIYLLAEHKELGCILSAEDYPSAKLQVAKEPWLLSRSNPHAQIAAIFGGNREVTSRYFWMFERIIDTADLRTSCGSPG